MSSFPRHGLVVAAFALILAIAFPFRSLQDHSHWDRVGWIPLVSPPIRATDVIGNVLLTIPAGFALASLGRSPVIAALAVAPVSLLCEWAQVYSHGRFPSATDFVGNVSGAVIGSMLVALRTRPVSR